MKFEHIELESDEKILSVVRRHWFFLVLQTMPLIAIGLLPVILSFFVKSIQPLQSLASQVYPHLFFIYGVWLLCIWILLVSVWTDYYLDMWCVTNRRIIKVDQVALFRRKTGSFRLERMQDVNVEVNGVLATLLDYGTIHVQTASADQEEFKASFLPSPQRIKATILEAADRLLDSQKNNITL